MGKRGGERRGEHVHVVGREDQLDRRLASSEAHIRARRELIEEFLRAAFEAHGT